MNDASVAKLGEFTRNRHHEDNNKLRWHNRSYMKANGQFGVAPQIRAPYTAPAVDDMHTSIVIER